MKNLLRHSILVILSVITALLLSSCKTERISNNPTQENTTSNHRVEQTPEANPAPVLYIYHTHTSEAYADDTKITAIGKELAEHLENNYDIKVIHDTHIYSNDLQTAYEESFKGMSSAAKNNPEIAYFIDVHRDSVREKTAFNFNETDTATINIIVGAGGDFEQNEKPNYEHNNRFASTLFAKLQEYAPQLANIYTREGRYNQHITGTAILIDIGNNMNTFDEAAATIPYLAEAIFNAIEAASV